MFTAIQWILSSDADAKGKVETKQEAEEVLPSDENSRTKMAIPPFQLILSQF